MRLRALAAAWMLACAGAPPAIPVPMPSAGETAGGEVLFLPLGSIGTSASFDARRVVGPNVNMTATSEGVWGGSLGGRNLVLQVAEGRLSGAAFEVTVEREGDALRLAGMVGDRRVGVRLSPQSFQGSVDGGVCSFELSSRAAGTYEGSLVCPARGHAGPAGAPIPPAVTATSPRVTSTTLKLSGDAARLDRPVLPQLALALLAVLPP